MKTHTFFCALAVFAIFFTACHKDPDANIDYRNKWIGAYDFTCISYVSPLGGPYYEYPPQYFIGTIKFGTTDSTILINYGSSVDNPTVNEQGEFYEKVVRGVLVTEGKFIGEREVEWKSNYFMLGGYTGCTVTGIKQIGGEK